MTNKLNLTLGLPREPHINTRNLWRRLHMDPVLLTITAIILFYGFIILFSAGNEDPGVIERQCMRMGVALIVMFILAQIPPDKYRFWSPWLFLLGLGMLLSVLIIGHIGKGAQRWLNFGVIKFQPSEVLKLALPMMLAWYFREKALPPTFFQLILAGLMILIPTGLTAIQPDLGTAVLIAVAGACVLLLAGISWWMIIGLGVIGAGTIPFLWHFLHDYQRQRVLTFLDPERDPLGSGYHIIQSKIAIGSGGVYGKGWLQGTQSHLQFLPEHSTDFIFAVCGEEFGLVGGITLVLLFTWMIIRCTYIAGKAQDTYSRLLAGSLAMSLFFAVFINIGMVTGILPVVGVPLPLISYGGSSIVTIFATLGILMSIHTHRKLIGS